MPFILNRLNVFFLACGHHLRNGSCIFKHSLIYMQRNADEDTATAIATNSIYKLGNMGAWRVHLTKSLLIYALTCLPRITNWMSNKCSSNKSRKLVPTKYSYDTYISFFLTSLNSCTRSWLFFLEKYKPFISRK